MFKLSLGARTYKDCSFRIEDITQNDKRISIISEECGAVCDVNVENNTGLSLGKNNIIVKDFGENLGLYDELKRLGIATSEFGSIMVGSHECPIVVFNYQLAEKLSS